MKKFLIFSLFVFYVSFAFAEFPEPYTEAKDITYSDKTFDIPSNAVNVSISRPAVPMKPFNMKFQFKNDNIKNISYTTNMKMNMGRYKYTPVKKGDSSYLLELILPKCGSGNTLWYGLLEVTYETGTTEKVIFFYNVK